MAEERVFLSTAAPVSTVLFAFTLHLPSEPITPTKPELLAMRTAKWFPTALMARTAPEGGMRKSSSVTVLSSPSGTLTTERSWLELVTMKAFMPAIYPMSESALSPDAEESTVQPSGRMRLSSAVSISPCVAS